MKKVLLSTSAVALVGAFAPQASAAEWEMRVGGYMEQYLAFASVDGPAGTDLDGVDSKQDAEIFFLPSITLDNGLKFGANIQLEGNTSGDQIDESYAFIQGSFGELLFGSENSAGYKMHYAAPDVSMVNVNSGSLGNFVPFSGAVGGVNVGDDVFRRTLGSTYIENLGGGNNDAHRFSYFTPRFAGFQLGVSYARDGAQDSVAQLDCNAITCDFFDVAVNYVNSFGDFNIAASARWGIASGPAATDPEVMGFGLNLGYGGFTIGGSFAEQNEAGADDGMAWDVGISYETGPWGFSFTYFRGENVDDENFALGADETLEQFLVAVRYSLAKGVDLHAYGAYVDFEEDLGDGGAGTPGNDIDGFVIGTGFKLSF